MRRLKTDNQVWLTSIDIAAKLEIKRKTWASYVARNQAPQPDWVVDNKPLWKLETIEKWIGERPGKGNWNG